MTAPFSVPVPIESNQTRFGVLKNKLTDEPSSMTNSPMSSSPPSVADAKVIPLTCQAVRLGDTSYETFQGPHSAVWDLELSRPVNVAALIGAMLAAHEALPQSDVEEFLSSRLPQTWRQVTSCFKSLLKHEGTWHAPRFCDLICHIQNIQACPKSGNSFQNSAMHVDCFSSSLWCLDNADELHQAFFYGAYVLAHETLSAKDFICFIAKRRTDWRILCKKFIEVRGHCQMCHSSYTCPTKLCETARKMSWSPCSDKACVICVNSQHHSTAGNNPYV